MSIDVAAGAVVCAAFFARIFQIQLRPYGLASLGISVWIIYSVDHLLDAHKLKRKASTKRHLFHQENFLPICIGVILAGLIDVVMILNIRIQIFVWGAGLIFIILLYLLFHHSLGHFKELMGAVLYSFGVLLPVLSLHGTPISTTLIFLVIAFILTALINLILFSWFDWQHDLKDTHISLVTFFGRHNTKILLSYLFIFQGVLLVGLLLITPYRSEAFIFIAMNFVLWLLFYFPNWFVKEEYYRLVGDVIFLFPLLYLFSND